MAERSKLIIFLLLLCGLAFNVLTIYTWDMSLLGNDAIQSVSTARNWLAGNGFSTEVLMYAPHFQEIIPAAQTVWPSGHPFALALISRLGIELEDAVLILNLVMHAAAAFVMYLVLLKLGVEKFIATLCTFAFYFLAVPWSYVSAGIAEPIVTTALLGALWFLPVPNKSPLLTWVMCGLLMTTCIFLRYSNVFLTFGVGCGIFFYLIFYQKTDLAHLKKPFMKLTLMISIPTIAFGYLMYRTITLIGTLDRYSGEKIPETIASTIKRWAAKSSELLGFASNEFISGPTVAKVFICFTLLVASLVFAFLISNNHYLKRSNSKESTYFQLFALVTLFHALALVGYISIQSVSTSPLEVLTRYIYQIYPCFYAIFCAMLFSLFKTCISSRKQALLKVTTSVVVALYIIAQPNSILGTRVLYFNEAKAAAQMMELPAGKSTNLRTFIQHCFEGNNYGKSIWSTHGQTIHLHTGIPSLTQNFIYTHDPFNAQEFQRSVTQYQVGMFIFINSPEAPTATYNIYMSDARNWLTNQGYAKVSLPDASFGQNRSVDIYAADPGCGF